MTRPSSSAVGTRDLQLPSHVLPRAPRAVRVVRAVLAVAVTTTVLASPALLPPASSASPLGTDAQTVAAQSKVAAKVKMGAAAKDQAAFDAFDREAGTFEARRTYNSTLPSSFMKSLARTDVAAGRISYWSFRPDPKTFAKDKPAQKKLKAFLATIPKGHQTVVVALHEPEDEIRAHKFTLKQWADTNNAVGRIVRATHRPELRHGICLMGPWTFDSRSPYYGYNWKKVLNFKYVDVVGIDPYKFRNTDPSLERMLTVANSGSGKTKNPSTMAKLSSWGKPVALMEFGVSATDRYTGEPITDEVRARWITDAAAWMSSWNSSHKVPIESASYFQLHPGGPYLTGKAVEALDAVTKD